MLINPPSGGFNLDGRTVNNAAGQTATWTGSGINDIVASDGSVFNNLGTFVADSEGLYKESGIGAASSFNNVGNYTTGIGGTGSQEFSVPFNVPGGSVDIADGRLDLDQGGTSTGAAFNVERVARIGDPIRLRHGHHHQRHRYLAGARFGQYPGVAGELHIRG